MKFFITGLLLWFTLTLPGSARGAGEEEHRILTFTSKLKEDVKKNPSWRVCGDYFAASESTEGKIVHFIFERGASEHLAKKTFTFATIDRLIVSLEEKAAAPMVSILWNGRNTRFVLKMNAKDYKAGLPCIAGEGTEV